MDSNPAIATSLHVMVALNYECCKQPRYTAVAIVLVNDGPD